MTPDTRITCFYCPAIASSVVRCRGCKNPHCKVFVCELHSAKGPEQPPVKA